ncbi:dienelactone hydrolase [Actinoplanes sp. SE50]|uniref:dienelactone hydrolase n=1 Tax=unclassified Actinoplanes TaxID=2626549 RepID=UPI00023EC5B3|nr:MULTISPECIES: dienelactone hydrolase [unclassified Actinoplanes]AEV83068.1 dienelactone hydrolase [Actinoplanes sp. SE50/110]ATO81464.1 dienelactone hydrolase [Actinoplanes sp. SE50]SLL98871.1 dienelactone hydrolase [Actinoplanes sp. SE50/110]
MRIHAAGTLLDGDLTVPPDAAGMVLFTQNGPRDRAVAAALHEVSLATLLIEPLTAPERGDDTRRFDVDLVADRVIGTLRWLRAQPVTTYLPIGLFGAGVNAAAALVAAAARPGDVQTVVTRGGRVDLAGGALAQLMAPALFIVGERDQRLRLLNEESRQAARSHADMCVIPGADRFFSGTQALRQVTVQAADWFRIHLAAPVPQRPPEIDTALPVEHSSLIDMFPAPSTTQERCPDDA